MSTTTRVISRFGDAIIRSVADFGRFVDFAGVTAAWLFLHPGRWLRWRTLGPQLYAVGVATIPVVAITGAFIGMVLALESYQQFESVGQGQQARRCDQRLGHEADRPGARRRDGGGPSRVRTGGGTGDDEGDRAARRAARHGGGPRPLSRRAALRRVRRHDAAADDLLRHSRDLGRLADHRGAPRRLPARVLGLHRLLHQLVGADVRASSRASSSAARSDSSPATRDSTAAPAPPASAAPRRSHSSRAFSRSSSST